MGFWDFLAHVLDTKGFVGLLFVAVGVGVFFVMRALWNTNQALHRELIALQEKRVDDAKNIVEDNAEKDRELYQAINKLDQTMKGYLAGRRRDSQ